MQKRYLLESPAYLAYVPSTVSCLTFSIPPIRRLLNVFDEPNKYCEVVCFIDFNMEVPQKYVF